MKQLKDILYKTGILKVKGSTEVVVEDIAFDSRKVRPGSVFVAVRGTQSDGHRFIGQVVLAGA
ncbi:MAG: Mur ligase domain-containing protein, partial [Bacteroidota bacterium]